jgi:phosphomannomutase
MKNKYNIHFGTDGWRGHLDSQVNLQTVGAVAQAFAIYLINRYQKDRIKVAIGFDGRLHSKKFATLFARVLSGNSIIVLLSDKIGPTPILSYYVKQQQLDAGVMITASHNPWEYNGIKFKDNYGGPFLPEETSKIEQLLGLELVQVNDDLIHQVDFRNQYVEHIEKFIDFDSIKRSGIKVLIDSMSGAGQQIIENILYKHDIRSKTIYMIAENESDRYAEPTEPNLVPLKEELSKNQYSVGIATDGDADRMGVMLENGEFLSSQETILLMCDYIINQKQLKGNIVKTASVTDKVRKFFQSEERKVIDTQIGFKYVCEYMLKEEIAFGAEESGGFGYGNHIPERDGILSSLIFIEMLAKSGYSSISRYVKDKRKEYGSIFSNRIDIPAEEKDYQKILNDISASLPSQIAGIPITDTIFYKDKEGEINGIKFLLQGDGWLLLRPSGTEKLVRIYAEAENEKKLNSLIQEGKNILSLS